jgi:VCBS repeat-containing protein
LIRRAVVAAVVLSLAITSLSAAALEGSLRLSWSAAAVVLSRRRAVEHPTINGPQAKPDSYSVLRGQTLTVSAANGVLANDTDPTGKPLSASVVTNPAHGTLTLTTDGGFTYVNDGSSATSDSFTYKAIGGTNTSAPTTVTITITGNPPIAVADAFGATQGQTLRVPAPGILANDTLNGAAISSYGASSGTEQATVGSDTSTAQNGTVNLKADGSFVYTGAGSFSGTDGFKYVVTNAAGASTAAVTITVTPPAPVASADSYTTPNGTALVVPAPGVFANDTLNGATLASYGATGVEQISVGSAAATAQSGSVILSANGGFTFTPAGGFTGSDTFQYVLRNAGGSSTGFVTIAVQPKAGPDFVVTSPGFFYTFNNVAGENPQLTLTRGRTYTFQINSSAIHPFEILGAPAGSVTNNNISSGIITFRVPTSAVNYSYICSIHGFGNSIVTVP